jgi:hypothetical protein
MNKIIDVNLSLRRYFKVGRGRQWWKAQARISLACMLERRKDDGLSGVSG